MVNTANYPNVGSENGIQALAAYVHGLGLKFGIYETAGISGQAVAANTPILGTSYTADDIATTKSQANYNCGGMDAINYSAPGAQAYTDSVVDELASWGVDYIKLDGISNSNTADVQAWQAAIQQSGRPMVLNITQGSYTIKLAPTLQEYANQWEFAPDIELNGPDEGSADACNNPPYTGCLSVFPLTSYADWSADRFASVAKWQPYGGPGGFNDYDSIEVGDGSADSGMSLAASESQLSLWSLGSAPLILGSDLTSSVTNAYGTSASLSPTDLSLLTNRQVIGVDQDAIDASRISRRLPRQRGRPPGVRQGGVARGRDRRAVQHHHHRELESRHHLHHGREDRAAGRPERLPGAGPLGQPVDGRRRPDHVRHLVGREDQRDGPARGRGAVPGHAAPVSDAQR